MTATIKDVARLAEVSFKTVSRVINKEPSVGEELRERVWAAIDQLDYRPNLSARQLRGAASFIAFIYDNPNSHYVIEMQQGLLEACHRQGFELLIHPVNAREGDVTEELLRLVSNGHIAGLVLTPPFSESTPLIAALAAREVMHVRILSGNAKGDQPGPCVYVDDYLAAYKITQYLVELGHRRIGFLGGEESHCSSKERLRGYLTALHDSDIAVDEALVLAGEYTFDSGAERTDQLLLRQPAPTAIFACNDEIAAGALFSTRVHGLEVPAQLSIIGFEDSPFSRQSWPRLTTAHQPNVAIADRAAELLIAAIRASRQSEDPEQPLDSGFQPQLVVRDSTCPPAS